MLLATAGSTAHARKIALVMGNSKYANSSTIPTGANDATDMAQVLQGLGYAVPQGPLTDLPLADAELRIDQFVEQIKAGDEVLIFYSGHAIELAGEGFILPIDYKHPVRGPSISTEAQRRSVARLAIDLQYTLKRIRDRGPAYTVLFLDACRDTPVDAKGGSSSGAKAPSVQGLSANEYVLYASAPGEFSYWTAGPNDRHRNSIYTRVLKDLIRTPGLSIASLGEELSDRVSDLIKQLSNGEKDQLPYLSGGSRQRIFLAGIPQRQSAQGRALVAIAPVNSAAARSKPLTGFFLGLGNTEYKPSSQNILTAKKGVKSLSDYFRELGYHTIEGFNLDRQELLAKLDAFITTAEAAPGDIFVVIYFNGHGMAIQNAGRLRQFWVGSGTELVPSAAVIASPAGRRRHYSLLADSSVSLEDDVYSRIRKLSNAKAIVILQDASRDFSDDTLQVQADLPPPNTVVAFATSLGRYAYSPRDENKHSFYTDMLVRNLKGPANQNVFQVLSQTALDTKELVNNIARSEGSLDRLLARLGLTTGYLQDPSFLIGEAIDPKALDLRLGR